MKYIYRKKENKVVKVEGSQICIPDEEQEIALPQFYCAGDTIPIKAVGKVEVCLDDEKMLCLSHTDLIPENINGFVIMDSVTRKLKYVPGKPPTQDIVDVPSIQELFLAGDTLPVNMLGTVNICLDDDEWLALGAGDPIPENMVGAITFDEVSQKAYFSNAVKDTVVSNQHIIDIAQQVISEAPDNVRTDAEILALIQTVIDADIDDVRSDAEIKSIVIACLDQLPDDQIRTDAEILVLVQSVVDQLPPDQVRSDEEIKAIAQACFSALSDSFLEQSEILQIIQNEIDNLPPDEVRSEAEIKAIALACVQAQGHITAEQAQILITTALEAQGDDVRTDEEINILIQEFYDDLPPAQGDTVRSDAEIKAIAQACIDQLPADMVRTDAEIEVIINAILDQQPPDQVRTDEQIKAIAQACIDASGQIRTDAEIKAIAENCAQGLVRTDTEINTLIQEFYDDLPPAQGDTVRSDAEIKAIAEACINLNARTDAQVKAIAQACVDALPPDQVRSDEEINNLIAVVVDALDDDVRTDQEIIDISCQAVVDGLSLVLVVDSLAPCESYQALTFKGTVLGKLPIYKTPIAKTTKRCYRNITGLQTVQIETLNDGGFSVDFGHAGDIQSGDNNNPLTEHNFSEDQNGDPLLEPVSGCLTITFNDPCDEVSLIQLSEDLLENSEPAPFAECQYA